ncbi:MAG: tannase/feruloyl esterase family alpha/beta hydrolase [Bryobacterales bacterium]|nr:tannase/feruloyl esterase family alpha/beta hydrolase [Bryobacterales bacterium]MBV9400661.1 tannase/feruloyl esterase family alpha/beta hydrolase [Bryobacterales bacterium]
MIRAFVFVLSICSLRLLAQQPCENLTKLSLPNTTITMAASVPAGSFALPGGRGAAPPASVPGFCRVAGVIAPEVNFELWLPGSWNRKFMEVGNGGLAGTINYNAMLDPLRRGYASSSTDTGHTADNDGHWALGHMQRVIDFAHRAVHVTAQADKAIIQAFYGAAPEHSYFSGCSQGGQEALTEAQRYPEDFDGIIAGDPANYWTHLYLGGHLWITQAMESGYIPASKTQLIGEAVYKACDALDGIKDGVINDPRRCHFDPSALLCKAGDAADCLTSTQVESVKKIYQGGRTPAGDQIFPGVLPGGEAGAGGWSTWITGSDRGRGSHTVLGMPFLQNVGFENPNWDYRGFRWQRENGFDSDVDFIDKKLGPIFNNMNPDLTAFRGRGGKLIQYHGYADPDISPLNSINYYESAVQFNGGLDKTKSFYRLFMVPGMYHCNGGPGPNTFDSVKALEDWIERGSAPEQMIASHLTNGAVDRTRPLCPYPLEAHWKGSGSTDRAENFACGLPKP